MTCALLVWLIFISGAYRLLRQILNETLRVATLATIASRYSDDDIVIDGYHIPAGTPILIAVGVLSRNQAVWKHAEK